jgi:hypothetical protein
MPIEFRFDEELGIIRTSFRGRITDSDLRGYYAALYKEPHYLAGTNELLLSEKMESPQISTSAMFELTRLSRDLAEKTPGRKIAFVPRTKTEYGYVRMYQNLTEGTPWERRIFDTVEEAIAWLKAPPTAA